VSNIIRLNKGTMNLRFYKFCLFLLAVSSSLAQQRPPTLRVTGFFSDMPGTPAGDVTGAEVWIVYAKGQYWATFQVADGEPDPPVLVPVEVQDASKVKFKITTHQIKEDGKPAPDLVTLYEGTVSNRGLLLSTPERSGSTSMLLKRRKS